MAVVGCALGMLCNKPTFRWIHRLMKEMDTEIACIRLGSTHIIPVTSPRIAQEFLRKLDSSFASRPVSMASSTLSSGYLAAVPLAPTGAMEEDETGLGVGGHQVNLRTIARHYCGNVIRRLMFNKRYFGKGSQDGGPTIDEEQHVDAIFNALLYLYAFCVSDYFPFLVGLDLDGHEKEVKRVRGTLRRLHEPIISERIKRWRDNLSSESNEKEPRDLLDVLIMLKDSKGMPLLMPQEIRAITTEIILAAVDNPSNAVEWAMAEMINQPELLHKATEEIDRVVGQPRPLSRVGLGRNPEIWDEPLKFKPDRHTVSDQAEVVLTEPELRFISFSTGRRGCIAATLGTTMTVMLLARLIQGFSWSKPSNLSSINLAESRNDLFLAEPLVAQAELRLPSHLYLA
ncbi:hypothetical protein NL676_019677 [Syzygium grande]|nr:hypothetical protein NL676_019677 [Syzygium grande]